MRPKCSQNIPKSQQREMESIRNTIVFGKGDTNVSKMGNEKSSII